MGEVASKRSTGAPAPLTTAAVRPVRGVAAWQRAAGNRATAAAVQRMIHRIGADETSTTNAANLHRPKSETESLRTLTVRGTHRPLDELGIAEPLHVVGHGDGAGHIEGMDGRAFVDYLVAQGFDGARHRGVIRLISCFSATASAADVMLSQAIVEDLRGRGFDNAVVSFDGLVLVAAATGEVQVVAPADVDRFNQIKDAMEPLVAEAATIAMELNDRVLAALLSPPSATPAAPLVPTDGALKARTQVIGEELAALRAEAEALKHSWKLGVNTRYVPSAKFEPFVPTGPTSS